jgi:hypothetical protein
MVTRCMEQRRRSLGSPDCSGFAAEPTRPSNLTSTTISATSRLSTGNIVGRTEADFDFRPQAALAEMFIDRGAQNGNLRPFPVVCCVGIPPLAEAPGAFEPEQA